MKEIGQFEVVSEGAGEGGHYSALGLFPRLGGLKLYVFVGAQRVET